MLSKPEKYYEYGKKFKICTLGVICSWYILWTIYTMVLTHNLLSHSNIIIIFILLYFTLFYFILFCFIIWICWPHLISKGFFNNEIRKAAKSGKLFEKDPTCYLRFIFKWVTFIMEDWSLHITITSNRVSSIDYRVHKVQGKWNF